MSRQFSISVRESNEGRRLDFRHEDDIASGASPNNNARLYFTEVERHLGVETSLRTEVEKLLGRRFTKGEIIAWIGHIQVGAGYEGAGVDEAFLEAMTREAADGGSSVLISSPSSVAVSMEHQDAKQRKYERFLVANGFARAGRYLVKVLVKPTVHNPFMAKPSKYYGPVTRGVATHPGFHTGESMIICQPYAQLKVSDFLPSSWDEEELKNHVMRDYPVIVELDMQGMPFTIDYDAANWFNDAVQAIIDESEDFDELESALDFSNDEEEAPEGMIQALFYLSGAQPSRASYSLLHWLKDQPDPYKAFARIKKKGLPDELLAKVSGQFRYTEDVPTGRIVAVHYIRPVFDYLFPHYEDQKWHHDEIIERIEEAGYDTVTLENVYDNSEVMTVARSFDVSPKLFPVKDQRIEYHGTSWRNLMAAAPQLVDVLPLPPKPFRKYDPGEEESNA